MSSCRSTWEFVLALLNAGCMRKGGWCSRWARLFRHGSLDVSGYQWGLLWRCAAQGRWYITAGLNPLFDTFDCQVHYFGVPEPGKLYGKINWRIPKGNADFIERSTVQTFDQRPLLFLTVLAQSPPVLGWAPF